MRCLKPRVGLRTVMEDTPDHLPDIGILKIQDVIDGWLSLMDGWTSVLPLRGKKLELPHYEHIAAHFRVVSGLDIEPLKNMQ